MFKISMKELAGLCTRLGTSLEAGLDFRAVWKHELDRARSPWQRRVYESVLDAVGQGHSVREAFDLGGDYFPLMFRELVQIGEESGRLGETFQELAGQYERLVALKRNFLSSILWPMIELAAAIVIIGVLIGALGVVEGMTGTRVDILGFGLVGSSGLAIYITFLTFIAIFIAFIYMGVKRGMQWSKPFQYLLLKIPVVRTAISAFALSRVAWTMSMTFNTSMDARRAVKMSVESARHPKYTDPLPKIDEMLARGQSLYESFLAAGSAYPPKFMDMLHTGEASGMIAETMDRLADQYQEEASNAMDKLSVIGFFLISGVVMMIIAMMILRIAMFYIGTIYDNLP